MSAKRFKFSFRRRPIDPPPIAAVREGIITGVRERSDVETMIRRYLELAATALDKDNEDTQIQEDMSA